MIFIHVSTSSDEFNNEIMRFLILLFRFYIHSYHKSIVCSLSTVDHDAHITSPVVAFDIILFLYIVVNAINCS